MAQPNFMSVLSLCLLLPASLALPYGYNEQPYPTLTVSSSDGIYPTGVSGTTGTGTGTGTAYYPTATGSAYIIKRDPDHPFGYPPPYKPSISASTIPSGLPTASSAPILSTFFPTGTAPPASGTGAGLPNPSYVPNKREVAAAKQAHRQHFEGPRKRDIKPYYPYVPSQSYHGTAGPSATAPTGATVSGVVPQPTGASAVPLPMPTGTSVIPLPLPTGGTGSAGLPIPSGTAGSGYSTTAV